MAEETKKVEETKNKKDNVTKVKIKKPVDDVIKVNIDKPINKEEVEEKPVEEEVVMEDETFEL